jgi:LPS-assembly protein
VSAPQPHARSAGTSCARFGRWVAFLALLFLLPALTAPAALGQQEAESGAGAPEEGADPASLELVTLPGDGEVRPAIAALSISEVEKGVYVAEGYVDLHYGGMRLQADQVTYDRNVGRVEAHGNVVLQQDQGTLSASDLEMNLETGEGTLWNVTGYQPPQYHFRAARLDRMDAEHYKIYDAEFTTCTQPVPYWSFKFKRGRIHVDHYAYLRNVSFRASNVPVVFSPYVVWPIKRDRATGFLMPEMGSSDARGTVINTAFFWAINRSMDATFFYDYYSEAGAGLGLEYRLIPNERGSVHLTGYELTKDVDVDESRRYRVGLKAEQRFLRGWRLLSKIDIVSDKDYYNDFERDLSLSVNSQQYSFVDLARSWSYYTFNVRADRREQYRTSSDAVIQQRLPEVEIRGRSQKLGAVPLYLSFEGSANNLERRDDTFDADYQRVDLGTTLSAPLTLAPWLDITPTLTLRDTYYTQSLDADEQDGVSDDSVNRTFMRFSFDILGPKLFRLFEPAPGSRRPRYKNTLEPRITYQYLPDAGEADEVIPFDEIDRVPAELNLVTYSLTSRLFQRRPIPVQEVPGEAPQEVQYESSREVASVEVRQSLAFNQDLSSSASLDETSSRGPVVIHARYNPSRALSADLGLDYDILFGELRSAVLSGTARSQRLGHARLSYYLTRGLEDEADDTGTLRLGGGSHLLGRRLSVDVDFSYDLGENNLQSQRYRVGYETQCCGFLSEYLERDYGGLVTPAREFRFSVTLKGVGTLFDLNSRIN